MTRRVRISDEEYIKICETDGLLDPNCATCLRVFYPTIYEGKSITDIFGPRHKASDRCQSGKYSHCSCDTCF